MSSLSSAFIAKLPIAPKHSWILAKINEAKGREFLYVNQIPEILEVLRQSAIKESVIASNLIENIEVSEKRAADLISGGLLPQDRQEKEFAAYQTALAYIHEHGSHIGFSTSNILNVHQMLTDGFDSEAGHFKKEPVFIVSQSRSTGEQFNHQPTSSPEDTPIHIKELVENYAQVEDSKQLDPMIYIPLAILDYLIIHPFHDGNGRTARLWTLSLLYRAGFQVGRYMSIERVIEERRAWYYRAIEQSSQGWETGNHNPLPWLEFFWAVMESVYSNFASKADVTGDPSQRRKGKSALVAGYIDTRIGSWTIKEVEQTFPGISASLIKKVHIKLQKENKIVSQGRGPGATWVRID